MPSIRFVVPGEPRPLTPVRAGRPTWSTEGPCREYQRLVAARAQAAGCSRLDGRLRVVMNFQASDAVQNLARLRDAVVEALVGVAWAPTADVDVRAMKWLSDPNPQTDIQIVTEDP